MNDRMEAINWWEFTIYDAAERVEWKFKLCYKYYGDRPYTSLTGREIENIWVKENQPALKINQNKSSE
jgi:hypothetical protein